MTPNEAIKAWLDANTTYTITKRDGDGKQPAGGFFTYKCTSLVREFQPEIGDVDSDGDVEIKHSAIATYSIQSFGSDPFGEMNNIRNSLEKITTQYTLNEAGIAYIQVTNGPTDVPAVTGTTFEARAIMDVTFRVPIIIVDGVGLIETVDFTGTVDEAERNTVTVTKDGISYGS